MSIYCTECISWPIYLYKRHRISGYVNLDTAYMKLLQSYLVKKQRQGLDFCDHGEAQVKQYYEPLHRVFDEVPDYLRRSRYPNEKTF
jgi:hypothetical protein